MAKEHKQVYSGSKLTFENISGDVSKFQVDINGNLVVTGNLNILGDIASTDVSQSTLQIDDKSIILNRGEIGPGVGATPGTSSLSGLVVDRGMYDQVTVDGDNTFVFRSSPYTPATFLWNETDQAWDLNTNLNSLNLDNNPAAPTEFQDRFIWDNPRMVNIGDPQGNHRTELSSNPLLRGTSANVGWVADITNPIELNIDNIEEYLNTSQSKTDNVIMYWRSNSSLRYGGQWSSEQLRIFYDKSAALGSDIDTNGYQLTYFGNYQDDSETSSRATRLSTLYLGDNDDDLNAEFANTTLWADKNLTIASEIATIDIDAGEDITLDAVNIIATATTAYQIDTPLFDVNATSLDVDGATSNINSTTSFTLGTPLADINATTEFDLTTPLADLNVVTFDLDGATSNIDSTSSFTLVTPLANLDVASLDIDGATSNINSTSSFTLVTPNANLDATTFDLDSTDVFVDAITEIQLTAPTVDVNATSIFTLDTPNGDFNVTDMDVVTTTLNVTSSTEYQIDTPLFDVNATAMTVDGATSNINSTTSMTLTSPDVNMNATNNYQMVTPIADFNASTRFQIDTPLLDVNATAFDYDGTNFFVDATTEVQLTAPTMDVNATSIYTLNTPNGDFVITDMDIISTTFTVATTSAVIGASTEFQVDTSLFDVNATTFDHDGTDFLSTVSGQFFVNGAGTVTLNPSGSVTLKNYRMPLATGTAGQAMVSDGAGNVNFSNVSNEATKLETARNIQVSGAVTGTASFDGTSNINIATTATSDPTLTLNGDVSGSATFINLGNATLTVTVADDSHNHVASNIDNFAEEVEDVVGAMVSGNTENGISVTYNDAAGKLDFNVSDPVISLSGDVTGSATMTDLSNTNIVVTLANTQTTNTTGNAATATALQTARNIAVSGAVTGTASFDGTSNITIATTATSDPTLTLTGDASGTATFTNLGNASLSVSVAQAATLTTARTIAVSGAVTGSTTFDGSGNVTIATTATSDPTLTLTGDVSGSATFTNLGNATLTATVADNSHNHDASNINAGTLSDARLPATISSNITGNAATATLAEKVTVLNNNTSSNNWPLLWEGNSNLILETDAVTITPSAGRINATAINIGGTTAYADLTMGYLSTSLTSTIIKMGYGSATYGYRIKQEQAASQVIAGTLSFERQTGSAWASVLTLNNNGSAVFAGGVTASSYNTSSALKYKENVEQFDNALDKVMQIDVIYYTSKDGEDKSRKVGVSADSLAKVAPEFVHFVDGEPDSVNYGQMTAMLIRAIQEQEDRRLVNKVKKLAGTIASWFTRT